MNRELITDITDYKKLNVDLFKLSDNHSLRFVVDLYVSDSFSLKGYYNNIYMRNNWNLVISGGKDSEFTSKINFCIGPNNIQQFNLLINNAVIWLTSKEYANLFYRQGQNVYINKSIQMPEIKLLDRFEKYTMVLSPAVFDNISTGISMVFDEGEPLFILASTVMNLKYFLQTFNPFQYTIELINYATATAILSRIENGAGGTAKSKQQNTYQQFTSSFNQQQSFLAKTCAIKRDD